MTAVMKEKEINERNRQMALIRKYFGGEINVIRNKINASKVNEKVFK